MGRARETREWSGDLPLSLRVPEFEESWKMWMEYRRTELKKPVTPISGKMALKRLESLGVKRAIAALEHSISNGWQGIFEPETKPEGAATSPQPGKRRGKCYHCYQDTDDIERHQAVCAERRKRMGMGDGPVSMGDVMRGLIQ